jgi:hypothetical protein
VVEIDRELPRALSYEEVDYEQDVARGELLEYDHPMCDPELLPPSTLPRITTPHLSLKGTMTQYEQYRVAHRFFHFDL